MHGRSRMTTDPRTPTIYMYNAGTEHARCSPTRQTLRAPSAKRRGVFGQSQRTAFKYLISSIDVGICVRVYMWAGFLCLCSVCCVRLVSLLFLFRSFSAFVFMDSSPACLIVGACPVAACYEMAMRFYDINSRSSITFRGFACHSLKF